MIERADKIWPSIDRRLYVCLSPKSAIKADSVNPFGPVLTGGVDVRSER